MSNRSVSMSVVLGLACLVGCGSEGGGSTTGQRIALHTVITTDPGVHTTFTTGFGWDVSLSRAALGISALYYFDGPPPTALLEPPKPSLGSRLASLFVGTAWAHPGHYQAGTALGEVILPAPIAYDLFSAAPVLAPDADAITGVYRSARLVIPQAAPADAALAGHVAVAEGRATKHDDPTSTPIYFRLIADYDDISMSVTDGAVDGCVLDEATVTSPGTITAEVRPAIWVNLVDFSKLDPGTESKPTEAHNAGFSQGVTQLSAYHFAYSK